MDLEMIRDRIREDLEKAIKDAIGIEVEEVHLEHPANPQHGDYSSNIALILLSRSKIKDQRSKPSSKLKVETPQELAEIIVSHFPEVNYLEKVEVAPPGFINFYLKAEVFTNELEKILKEKDHYGSSRIGEGKKILLEHTSPDPFKPLHVGHLRNNFLGMSVARLLKFTGHNVTLDCIINDRGTHVSRVMWGYLVFARKGVGLKKEDILNYSVSDEYLTRVASGVDWKQLLDLWLDDPSSWLVPEDLDVKSDHFDQYFYALGDRAEKNIEEVKEQVRQILREWENKNEGVRALWRQIIDWGLAGQKVTYEGIGSYHDHVWYESNLYEKGKELVNQGLTKGVFRESEGAIVSNLSQYGLPDTIVIRSDGTTLYHTYDINLTLQKRKKFPSDLYIWDIGNDQILYLKQLFAMCEQLGIGKRSDYFHLCYGYIYLKSGERMKSREGTVITGDELIKVMCERAAKVLEESELGRERSSEEEERIVNVTGLGALKYGLLKYARESDIHFDIEGSVSLKGDSGPYIQYTHARARSIVRKAGSGPLGAPSLEYDFSGCAEELTLVKLLSRFPEVVMAAAESYAPSLICSYFFDLSQCFNLFYERVPVLPTEDETVRVGRLALTSATAQVIKNGLYLLGIGAPERM